MKELTKELRDKIENLVGDIPDQEYEEIIEIIEDIDQELESNTEKINELEVNIEDATPEDVFAKDKESMFLYGDDVKNYIYECFESLTMKNRQDLILLLLTGHHNDKSNQTISHAERDAIWELIRKWDHLK